jgi:hypothetical protein
MTMKRRILLPGLFGLLLSAPLSHPVGVHFHPAYDGTAAEPVLTRPAAPARGVGAASTARQNCARLEARFDAAPASRTPGTKIGQAKVWRTEGAELCRGRHPAMGEALLERALRKADVAHG